MNKKTKIVSVIWDTYGPMMREAARKASVDLFIVTHHEMKTDPEAISRLEGAVKDADIILYYKSNQDFWGQVDEITDRHRSSKKIISVGSEPTYWAKTNVDHDIAITTYSYLMNNGQENCNRMMVYLENVLMGSDKVALPPEEIPWQGIVHPDAKGRIFDSTEEYLKWYRYDPKKPWVGIVATRSAWVSDGCVGVEFPVLRDIEKEGANVIMFYSMSTRNADKGTINIADGIRRYLMDGDRCRVSAIVKLASFLVGFSENAQDKRSAAASGAELLEQLNIPVYQPVIASNQSIEKWRNSPGLAEDIAWMIAFPEFEGVIEPIMLAATRPDDDTEYQRTLLPKSSKRLAERVMRRIRMAQKPAGERKVIFFLNNHPCASVEANVGGASHLDTHESLANILKAMKAEGYSVDPPEDGKALITNIMDHKAISEFRWTTVQEISKHGGVIYRMPVDEYNRYFETLEPVLKKKIIETWGEPPGKSMVLDNDILITGVSYGNVILAVQPKRGCYGARCDGEVCKILHDPLCPPTHQYLASYFYYEEMWGADAVVHVGTHGNLEFLPGKTAGVSTDLCYPMIGIGKVPHLYIYNSDNPPEGTVAKRRSSATLVDHMQCVMVNSSLYDDFTELDDLLAQYENARHDPSHSHQLQHMIVDAANKAKFTELNLTHDTPLDQCVSMCHEALSRIRNSQMNMGMHVIGTVPQGDMRVEFINSILRYDTGSGSIRDLVAEMMDVDLDRMYKDQGGYDSDLGLSNGAVIEIVGDKARDMIGALLDGKSTDDALNMLCLDADDGQVGRLEAYRDKVLDISKRIDDSHEIEALLNGFAGGYVPPGPSGLITRGRPDILPTGKNFYSLDPYRFPTDTAWRVGTILADGIMKKYFDDTGEIPENIAFFWMCNDLLTADGEMMSQMMSLMGVKPVWRPNGQVHGYEVVPLGEMKHPRIDVTVRTSGIMRDNFINCVDLLDAAVRELSELDEPEDMNFIRKHTQESLSEGVDFEEATARFFCAPPGSYVSGVNLAVFASSWNTEKDLSDIFIASNGYAYGGDRNGKAMHGQFAANLSTVNITYNKTASDEHDLLGCCCYFSNQGGLTAASRQLSGKEVKSYYGDTREPKDINVHTLADEIRRTVRTKLFNPRWIEGMKEHGYKGASDIMKRITRVYGWEASTQEVDDWIFDDITSTFVNDPVMKKFFQDNNPYALEEIARRMLEAQQRGLWNADEDVLEELKQNYVEIESWMEELAGEGEYQGGSIDIITSDKVEGWDANLSEITAKIDKRMRIKKKA